MKDTGDVAALRVRAKKERIMSDAEFDFLKQIYKATQRFVIVMPQFSFGHKLTHYTQLDRFMMHYVHEIGQVKR